MFVIGYYFHSCAVFNSVSNYVTTATAAAAATTTTTTTLSDIRPYSLLQFHGITLVVFHL
jgi:hypothetical protein